MQNHNLMVKLMFMLCTFVVYIFSICVYLPVVTEYPNLQSTRKVRMFLLASETLLAGPRHLKGLFEGLNMVLRGVIIGLESGMG